MFTDGNNRPSPGLRALLGRFLYSLLPHRFFQLVGAAWSYMMGPWEASSFLPSGWMIHRSVQSGDLPEVLEALGLRPGSWEELGECLDELGPWKEFIGPEVGVDLELLKSWKGVSAGKDVESALNELTAWQKTMVHNNMQVFWEPGLTPWKEVAEMKQQEDDECHKPASASYTISSADNTQEHCKVALESSSLGIISYILNVGTSGVEWKDDGTVEDSMDHPSQNEFEIQHIRNKRLTFLQQNKTLEGPASDAKLDVPDLPDTTCFSSSNHPVSNLSLDLTGYLESQSQPVCAQCELVSNISLAEEDLLKLPETFDKCSSCEQLPVVIEEVHRSGHVQQDCPPSPDKDQGYHSLEYWQCPPLLTAANIETPDPCELITQSTSALPAGLPACPLDRNDGQSSEHMDFNLQQEIPAAPPVTLCTNKHIGYILGTVVSDDEEEDDDISDSSSDKGDKEDSEEEDDDDDGFDSEGSLSSTDSDTDVHEDVLWNSFCSADPYNLQNFTATIQTGVKTEENSIPQETLDEHQSDEESWCDSNTESDSDSDCSADEEENLKLWNAFSKSDDPYNPLYFKAPVQTSNIKRQTSDIDSTYSDVVCRTLPNHKVTLVTCQAYDHQQLQLTEAHNVHLEDSANLGRKKVTFHDKVTIHYICNEEERKGHWEELARDRCRFQRRIKETEFVIGHCLTPHHRQRVWERMQRQWDS